jgi:hypothetical protein
MRDSVVQVLQVTDPNLISTSEIREQVEGTLSEWLEHVYTDDGEQLRIRRAADGRTEVTSLDGTRAARFNIAVTVTTLD